MIFNFGKHKTNYEPGKRLFVFFDGQAGLPMEPGYNEVILTATENHDKMRMDVCIRPTGDGEVETKTTYIVSAKVLDDVMKIVKKHNMVERRKHNYPCMCGRRTYCEFMWKGETVGVSLESMSENGEEIFDCIQAVLYGYATPAAISEEANKDFVATLKVSNVVRSTMSISTDGNTEETEKAPEPETINIRAGSQFYGFTVTEVKEDYMRFNADIFRYIVNNGPIEKEFIIHKGENLRLDLVDILDANDSTVIELLDVKESDQ